MVFNKNRNKRKHCQSTITSDNQSQTYADCIDEYGLVRKKTRYNSTGCDVATNLSKSRQKLHMDVECNVSTSTNQANTSLYSYSSISKDIMESMGFVDGEGLGVRGQGITDPVIANTERISSKHGFGHDLSHIQWDESKDPVVFPEHIEWFGFSAHDEDSSVLLEKEDLSECWLKFEKTSLSQHSLLYSDEFCRKNLSQEINSLKSNLSLFKPVDVRRARARANVFETISSGSFLNRAAMKLANIDSAFDFLLSNPAQLKLDDYINMPETFHFADICAGPGGFTEYFLWKRSLFCKGFGFTLRNKDDFRLDWIKSGPLEHFHPFYGVHGDGDIYKDKNQSSFKQFVMANTNNVGVDVVTADGGFSVEKQESLQEVLSKQLYLCECLVALQILRPGGTFLCKLFDVFTRFSVGLIFLMAAAFKEICIFKPCTSRPANSERYLICKGRLTAIDNIIEHLRTANLHMLNSTNISKSLTQLVPCSKLNSYATFIDYIKRSNNRIGEEQIVALDKLGVFLTNQTLTDQRQIEVRRRCFDAWCVPDARYVMSFDLEPSDIVAELNCAEVLKLCKLPNKCFPSKDEYAQIRNSQNDWCFQMCSSKDRFILLSNGHGTIWRLSTDTKWQQLTNIRLPARTILLAELSVEIVDGVRLVNTLNILDAFWLVGVDVRRHRLRTRLRLTQTLIAACEVSHPADSSDHGCSSSSSSDSGYRCEETDIRLAVRMPYNLRAFRELFHR